MLGATTTPDQRETSRRTIIRVLFSIAAMLVVLCVVFFFLMDVQIDEAREGMRLAEQIAHWPTARGVVAASSVQETRIPQGKGSVRGCEAEVLYTYTVHGESYTGGIIHFCYAPSRSLEYAESLAARYPRGAGVDVAYDPEAPRLSVLEPGYADPCRAAEESLWLDAVVIGSMIARVV